MSGCPVAAAEEASLKTLAGAPRVARGAISHKPSALRERAQLFSKLSNIEQILLAYERLVILTDVPQ